MIDVTFSLAVYADSLEKAFSIAEERYQEAVGSENCRTSWRVWITEGDEGDWCYDFTAER